MKKRLLVIALFMGGLVFTSCEICTTCTKSGVTIESCGKKSIVKDLEDDLESSGYTCVRD